MGKIITVAGALEDGAVTPDRYFTVPWQYDCTNDTSNGILQRLAPARRRAALRARHHRRVLERRHDPDGQGARRTPARTTTCARSGSVRCTALDFPGESPGILKPWQEWEGTERCTIFYGQGVASTPVQLTAAVNTIANGGVYVAPRLVSGYVGGDGEVTDAIRRRSRTAW